MDGLPNFITHGAPLARFARRSSAINYLRIVLLLRCRIEVWFYHLSAVETRGPGKTEPCKSEKNLFARVSLSFYLRIKMSGRSTYLKEGLDPLLVSLMFKVIPLNFSTIKLFLKLGIINIHDMNIQKMQ